MKHSKIKVNGADALRIETGALALEVTTGVGPRITSFASRKGKAGNLFLELGADETPYAQTGLKFIGGHRLWHAPEHGIRTYQPDAEPVALKPLKNGIALAQPTEAKTGMQKAVKIEFLGERTVRVTHALTNENLWPVETACWALTMFRPGGYGVVPLLPKGDHAKGDFLPTYSMVPWSYTDLSLDVWDLHRDYYGIDVEAADRPHKLGLTNYPGWSAYWFGGTTFVKYAPVIPGAVYPDNGCAFETFTNGQMCELETLGALTKVEPGKSIQHVEHWTLLDGLKEPSTDGAFDALASEVAKWIKTLKA
jgi:hypothetical protein